MSIFTKDHLILNAPCTTQLEAFQLIAKKARELGVIENESNLVDGLVRREEVSTTGMAQSFAIPHAMNSDISKPAIIAVRFKNGIDWKSFDGQPVKFAIALLIPKENLSDLHMEYLARISTALMDEEICKGLLTAKSKDKVYSLITNAVNENDTNLSTIKNDNAQTEIDSSKPFIIAVTACATGIAHTFMAREALEKGAKELGYGIHVETEGQNGREHEITPEMIEKADYVIIATDISVDTERFSGKKIYFCDTNAAINNPTKTIKTAMSSSQVHGNGQTTPKSSSNGGEFKKSGSKFDKFMKPFLSGVSHMIPVIVFSGIIYALLNAINMVLPDSASGDTQGTTMWYAMQVANIGFSLFTGIMGAYIAEAIGGRAAFGPGLIATTCASTPSLYFFYKRLPEEATGKIYGGQSISISGISLAIFAAIMMGFAAGYLVKWINTWKIKPIFRSLMSIIFIPVVGSAVLVFPFEFLLSGILGCAMNYFALGLAIAGSVPGVNFLIGFVLGAMVGVDMGGPINKIAVATGTGLITLDPRLMGACAAAIPIAPLGCGLATVLFRKVFNDDEKKIGVSAIALGCMGISEGAIPMFAKNPKQTLIANIIGSAIAGGLAFCFFCGGHVAMWGGPLIALFLGVSADPGELKIDIPSMFGGSDVNSPLRYISILWYFLAIGVGMVVQMFIYGTLVGVSRGTDTFVLNGLRKTGNKIKGIFKQN